MQKVALTEGIVVQINPESNVNFGGCFMIVQEPTSWGAKGIVLGPGHNGRNGTGVAYYQCKFEDMELVGHAAWAPKENTEENDDQEG